MKNKNNFFRTLFRKIIDRKKNSIPPEKHQDYTSIVNNFKNKTDTD